MILFVKKEVGNMIRKKEDYFNKGLAMGIALFGSLFALVGAHSFCMCIFHQPEKPDLSKLRKF